MTATASTLSLMDRARRGDRTALGKLFDTHGRRLAVRIHFRLGPQLRHLLEVEDILQETYLRAYADFDTFTYRTPGSFMHWMSSIADHVIVDLARHHGRQKRRPRELVRFRSEGNPLGAEPIDTRTPSRALAEDEDLRSLLEHLEALSPEYREVILLAKVEGLSTAEVAEHLGKTREGVALLLHRAIKRLQQLRTRPSNR